MGSGLRSVTYNLNMIDFVKLTEKKTQNIDLMHYFVQFGVWLHSHLHIHNISGFLMYQTTAENVHYTNVRCLKLKWFSYCGFC